MGNYLGVKEVKRLGRRLGSIEPEHFQSIKAQLYPGEELVVLANNGAWTIAGHLPDQAEYQRFFSSWQQGAWQECVFMGIGSQRIKECPDSGRVSERSIIL